MTKEKTTMAWKILDIFRQLSEEDQRDMLKAAKLLQSVPIETAREAFELHKTGIPMDDVMKTYMPQEEKTA